MKRLADLTTYTGTLPYASETFGIYQPLLGWKSSRMQERIDSAGRLQVGLMVAELQSKFEPRVQDGAGAVEVQSDVEVEPGQIRSLKRSGLLAGIASELPALDDYSPDVWERIITVERVTSLLQRESASITRQLSEGRSTRMPETAQVRSLGKLKDLSRQGALLLALKDHGDLAVLESIFYGQPDKVAALWEALRTARDPFARIDPTSELDRVGLSPVGVAHLFRQYFFDLETFLGTPVGHVWLTPGGSAELVEVQSRRNLVERVVEQSSESTVRTEVTSQTQDELSEAVKDENQSNLKLGVNVSATQSWGWGSANESASFGYDTTQKTAREQTHKVMRQQSEKLTTEIKKNFKTTFRTVNEVTDVSSKRYVLENTTDKLVNYELRRKMRHVAVQVQDIGSYLCWQTYVDRPGRSLGLGTLVHVGASPEISNVPPPDMILPPKALVEEVPITIPFLPVEDGDASNDEAFRGGKEVDVDMIDNTNYIQWKFRKGPVRCKQPGYRLANVAIEAAGATASLSVHGIKEDKEHPGAWNYVVHLDEVNFEGVDSIAVKAILHWEPTSDLKDEIDLKNAESLSKYTAQTQVLFQRAFIEAARERIRLASELVSRPTADLREEERTVIYRSLIQDLLAPDSLIPQPDAQTQHVVAELINSIFDVDKLLYFVAPEWWRPRTDEQRQHLGGVLEEVDPQTGERVVISDDIPKSSQFTWGDEVRPGNYYVTEKSAPARLGSSLGWLLQLDGDDHRNAFLNAPWVKAVLPIRPGREKAALNWLKHVEGMNGIEATDLYGGPEPEWNGQKTLFEVLEILASRVAEKNASGTAAAPVPDPMDPDSSVTATPVDRVFETGFDPLEGGFRAKTDEDYEIFDQWTEVLPTDQVVALEVTYDPKTGRQV